MKYTLYYSVIRNGKHYRLFAHVDEKWKTVKFNSLEEAKDEMTRLLEKMKYNNATYGEKREGVTFKIKNSNKEYVYEETFEF